MSTSHFSVSFAVRHYRWEKKQHTVSFGFVVWRWRRSLSFHICGWKVYIHAR